MQEPAQSVPTLTDEPSDLFSDASFAPADLSLIPNRRLHEEALLSFFGSVAPSRGAR